MSKLFQELKRRKVFKVAAVYAVVAWLLIQVATAVTPALQLPTWTPSLVVVLLLLGFIPALIAAWAYELTPDGITSDAPAPPAAGLQATSAQPVNYVILVVVLVVAAVQLAERITSDQATTAITDANPTAFVSGTQRTSIVLPARQPIIIDTFPSNSLALSPDGRTLVYVAENRDLPADRRGGRKQLFLRSLNSRTISALPETFGAGQPFFSPDGQAVAFFTRAGELKKIALSGGAPVTLTEGLSNGRWGFGVWNDEDDIVYSNVNLFRIPAGGGTPEQLTTLNVENQEFQHRFPTLVPGNRAVLFTVDSTPPFDPRIEALLLDSGERRVVLDNASGAHVLASGHVLFQRDSTVMLAPFDFATLTVGPAVAVPEAIRIDNAYSLYPHAQLTLAANGSLAYLPELTATRELGTLAPGGSFEPFGLANDYYSQPRVAPDGRAVSLLLQRDRESVLYTYDLERGTTARLSQDSNSVLAAAWRPDGGGLAMVISRQGIFLLENGRQTLLVPPGPGYATRNMRWTPDGTELVYTRQRGIAHDLWIHDIDGAQADRPLLATQAAEEDPALSPDGKWLAFTSDESGRRDIYIQAYPDGERHTVSLEGGRFPLWSADGSAIFFVGFQDDIQKMLRVAVTAGPSGLQLGSPEPLFDMRYTAPDGTDYSYHAGDNIIGAGFDLLPDGRFVLLRSPESDNREVVVVQSWFDEVRRLAPVPTE